MQIKVKRSRKRNGKAYRNIQKIARLRKVHRKLLKKTSARKVLKAKRALKEAAK
jgi:hypothetical protein